jgi:hypothetical protein
MMKRNALAIILILTGIVFLVDELWMFGLPIGHILPNLSEFHITILGLQYHHWMTGTVLIVLALIIFHSTAKGQKE